MRYSTSNACPRLNNAAYAFCTSSRSSGCMRPNQSVAPWLQDFFGGIAENSPYLLADEQRISLFIGRPCDLRNVFYEPAVLRVANVYFFIDAIGLFSVRHTQSSE